MPHSLCFGQNVHVIKSRHKFSAISVRSSSSAKPAEGEAAPQIQTLPQRSHKSDIAPSSAWQRRRSMQPPPSQGGRPGISCHHLGIWPHVKYAHSLSPAAWVMALNNDQSVSAEHYDVESQMSWLHHFIPSDGEGLSKWTYKPGAYIELMVKNQEIVRESQRIQNKTRQNKIKWVNKKADQPDNSNNEDEKLKKDKSSHQAKVKL